MLCYAMLRYAMLCYTQVAREQCSARVDLAIS
jgi:hypothetical protein